MKRVCLPKKERDDFVKALRSKELTIESLYGMKSAERRAALTKHVGGDEEFGKLINARFERAMLSKQKSAMVDWIKSTISQKSPIRRDMLKKVERVKEALSTGQSGDFLQDLAETKLGMGVTQEEAEAVLKLKTTVDEMRVLVPENSPIRSEERLAYGLSVDRFKNYVGDLKLQADTLSLSERVQLKNTGANIIDTAGAFKSVVASLDNSFIGRQGIKALLMGEYKVWGTSAAKSFQLIGQELMAKTPKGMFPVRDDAVMALVRADIYSRPNAMNGKYAASKNGYGLGQFHEEAFPTSIPSRLPFLGKAFKASETAFTGSALRMRADLADAMIASAEKNGVDMLDETQASAIGNLVTSLTGRGELTTTAAMGREINALMFAPRFLKANFNTLTAHMFDKTMTPYARRQAAKSTMRIAASITAVLAVADAVNPGSVEWDPRSPNFGKITIGEKRFDITGGMSGLVTLGSRITPTLHNGEWGFWTKSGSTGKYTKMSQGEYGEQTALDVFERFFEGKLSPAAGAIRDVWKGQKYSGDKPTFVNTTLGLITPISAQILQEELKKGNDDVLFGMIAEGLGFSSSDATFRASGKRWKELSEIATPKEVNTALKTITKNFNARADELKDSPQWDIMTTEERSDALQEIKDEETNSVLGAYGL